VKKWKIFFKKLKTAVDQYSAETAALFPLLFSLDLPSQACVSPSGASQCPYHWWDIQLTWRSSTRRLARRVAGESVRGSWSWELLHSPSSADPVT